MIESLDYDQIENRLLLRELAADRTMFRKVHQFWGWIVVAAVGVATGLTAFAVLKAANFLTDLKFKWTINLADECDDCLWKPLLFYVFSGVILCLMSVFLTVFIQPAAGGGGISQIKGYLNGVKIPNIVRLSTYFVKVIGVTLAIAGGLVVGKASPMVHSGAIIAAGFLQGQFLSLGNVFGGRFARFRMGIASRYRNDQQKRDFIAAGVAAGIAASYGAPLGGLLFAIEDSASFWRQKLIWRICLCGALSAFTLNFLVSGIDNKWGLLVRPGLVKFGDAFTNGGFTAWQFPLFLLIAIIGGLMGSLFVAGNLLMAKMRKKYFVKRKWLPILEVFVVSLITGLSVYLIPYLAPVCVPFQNETWKNRVDFRHFRFYCKEGSYNQMATLFFASQEGTMEDLLSKRREFAMWELLVFVPFQLFFAGITSGMAIPSGLLVPSLVAGAAYGRAMGQLLLPLLPQMQIEPVVFALLGASAMLSGIFRTPISLTAIIIEGTSDISLSLPIMFTVFVAKWVGDFFDSGLYNAVYQVLKYPILPWDPPSWATWLQARHVMKTNIVKMKAVETVENVVNILRNSTHNGFPVIREEDNRFAGIILRSQLTMLLKENAFVYSREDIRNQKEVKLETFRNAYPRFPSINNIKLTSEQLNSCYINLDPYINLHPYTVHADTSFGRVFKLFRSMGMRHLCDGAAHLLDCNTGVLR
eukprot:TRINITY_DN2117_c0_g1_i1.p1 TRINITY_DN2117_c0_g1~~TRINITY_DN2117_c0_g1_i1.p1  ORF type:complete len:763 (-),score=210.69 TRINITY_DN2117_c0_g1_i1:92-2188(-)